MEQNLLLTQKRERVFSITFNRPERRNAFSPLLLYQLSELLGQLKEEDEVRCIVLRGEGEKAFSSGYDVMAIPTGVSPEVMEALRKKNRNEVHLQYLPQISEDRTGGYEDD